jgi:hypothetical protein
VCYAVADEGVYTEPLKSYKDCSISLSPSLSSWVPLIPGSEQLQRQSLVLLDSIYPLVLLLESVLNVATCISRRFWTAEHGSYSVCSCAWLMVFCCQHTVQVPVSLCFLLQFPRRWRAVLFASSPAYEPPGICNLPQSNNYYHISTSLGFRQCQRSSKDSFPKSRDPNEHERSKLVVQPMLAGRGRNRRQPIGSLVGNRYRVLTILVPIVVGPYFVYRMVNLAKYTVTTSARRPDGPGRTPAVGSTGQNFTGFHYWRHKMELYKTWPQSSTGQLLLPYILVHFDTFCRPFKPGIFNSLGCRILESLAESRPELGPNT